MLISIILFKSKDLSQTILFMARDARIFYIHFWDIPQRNNETMQLQQDAGS